MSKPALCMTVLVCTVIVLSLVQVVISNFLSTTGISLVKLEDDTRRYQTQNAILSEELLSASSFTMIASRASSLGFTNRSTRVHFTSPLPVALRR